MRFVQADVRDAAAIAGAIRGFGPDCVFHVAGQVAMTTSISDPRLDFETNALGTFNILEALRQHAPRAQLIYSSTNKVYGDLEQFEYREEATRYACPAKPDGFGEDVAIDPRSPYGCSKCAADQYVLDYHRVFGLRTTVLRHSSMYGGRQFATFDQGWIGWFVRQALEQSASGGAPEFTIAGNGKQVRDALFADDMVALYFRLTELGDEISGRAFNVGGGMRNSLSLLELFDWLERRLGMKLRYAKLPPRFSDQKVFVADLARLTRVSGWQPRIGVDAGLARMLEWQREVRGRVR
jgi:CDP-paratose 2-epimerase